MSRKASTTSECFVSNKNISERVFKHKLAELFGSKAIYSEAPSGDGWLVRKCSRDPKAAVKQLESDTILVENAVRDEQERANQERAKTQRASTRIHPDFSGYSYGKPSPVETRLPLRITDSERNENESQVYGRVASRPQPVSDPYRPYPVRHSSIVERDPDVSQPPGYMNTYALAAPGQATTDASTRSDGHSIRYSSLLPGSSPQDIPQSSSRHNTSQDLMRDRDGTVNEMSTPLGRSATRDRHAGYGSMTAKTALRDFKHVYVQADFPDIFQWQQYNLEREQYNRERAELEARMRRPDLRRGESNSDDSLSESSTDEKTAASRHPRAQESKPFAPIPSNTRRHKADSVLGRSSRVGSEFYAKSQIMKPSRPREGQVSEAPPAYEATAQRRPLRHDDDRYDPSERPPRPPTPPSRPDSVIGRPIGGEGGGGKQPKSSKEALKANPKELVKSNPISKSRHDLEARMEVQKPAFAGTALVRTSSKDQGKVGSKSMSKGTLRHHKDSTSRTSRPAADRHKSYHDEDRESERSSSSEEDVVVQPNSRRPRDPEYNERRRHK